MGMEYREEDLHRHIQELEVGDKFFTKSKVVTRTEVELYATINGDTLPAALSEAAAKERGWKGQLVPGLLTFSQAMGLLIQSGFIMQAKAFLGCDGLRFNKAVYVYDEIRVEAEVLSKERKEKNGKTNWFCRYKWVVRNQLDENVAEGINIGMFNA
ncbi:MAG: MaoC family dehydratase [Deltaproteobacteria bacterium]|nr:MaoC family dehydratase [Deltaproteobacteria bacterium]